MVVEFDMVGRVVGTGVGGNLEAVGWDKLGAAGGQARRHLWGCKKFLLRYVSLGGFGRPCAVVI